MVDADGRPFARIRLGERIGRGGMAEVFAAKLVGPAGFEKDVAVKRLLPRFASDPVFLERFLNEARLAARLSHPNIVQIFELGHDGQDHYIVMEAVRGQSLRAVLAALHDRGELLPVPATLHVAHSVCAGLGSAHEQLRIVHRDVSPHNVVVSFDGAVKVIDFGIARVSSESRLTQVGQVIGKLRYMSPEQIGGDAGDARSDLFSVGIMLFEMLAGAHPFDDGTGQDVAARIRDGVRPGLLDVAPDIDAALASVVERALATKPEDRFASARALDDALTATRTGASAGARDLEDVLLRLFAEEAKSPWPVEDRRSDGAEQTATGAAREISISSDIPDGPANADRSTTIFVATPPRPAPRRWLLGAAAGVLVASAAALVVVPRAGCADGARSVDVPPPAPLADGGSPSIVVAAAPDAGSADAPAAPAVPDAGSPVAPPPEPVRQTKSESDGARGRERGKDHRRPARPRAARLGELVVETRPWTRVRVDGRALGVTPLRLELSVGRHRVLLENEESGVRRELEVRIATSPPTILRLDLRRPPASAP